MASERLGNIRRKILIVEDNELNREILSSILEEEFDILCAPDGCQGLDMLSRHYRELSLVILDVYMPVCDGFEFLKTVSKDPLLSTIPVLVATGSENSEDEVRCLKLGAADFVTKPYNPEVVVGRVHSIIRLSESVATLSAVEYDSLTGLYTMQAFYHHAKELLEANANEDFELTVCDVQNLSLLNSVYGQKRGNEILVKIANIYKTKASHTLVARNGENFFCLYKTTERPEGKATDIFDAISISILNVRFGVYVNVDKSLPVSALCDRVVLAIAGDKENHRGSVSVYNDSIQKNLIYQQKLESSFDQAIADEEFVVFYQGKFDPFTEKMVGAEALVRWKKKDGSMVYPSDFIPLFEQDGLISSLDLYVFKKVCQFQKKRILEGKAIVPISINLSRNSIYQNDVVSVYENMAKEYGISLDLLPIELTETAAAESEDVSHVMENFSKVGFPIHIDDFGRGYSSLSSLVSLPFDTVKLDKSLIDHVSDKKGTLLIRHLLSIAKDLGMKTVAEGVEERSQVEILKALGCFAIQGYYFSPPRDEQTFTNMLDSQAGSAI